MARKRNNPLEINGKRAVKEYAHNSYMTSERIWYYQELELSDKEIKNLESRRDSAEVEILVDTITGKIIGCNGFLLSENKYE